MRTFPPPPRLSKCLLITRTSPHLLSRPATPSARNHEPLCPNDISPTKQRYPESQQHLSLCLRQATAKLRRAKKKQLLETAHHVQNNIKSKLAHRKPRFQAQARQQQPPQTLKYSPPRPSPPNPTNHLLCISKPPVKSTPENKRQQTTKKQQPAIHIASPCRPSTTTTPRAPSAAPASPAAAKPALPAAPPAPTKMLGRSP